MKKYIENWEECFMPRIEKGFGERSTDDIVRDILREYSNRENPISAKNIEGIAKRKGVETVSYTHLTLPTICSV